MREIRYICPIYSCGPGPPATAANLSGNPTMKDIIEVRRTDGTFSTVVIGNVLADLPALLPDRRVIVITDANVHRRYPDLVNRYEHILVGMGETNKTLITVGNVYSELLARGVDRKCFILGIGGGIVTDIAGFVASTYMRGLRFGFIASTLLAQVDASVGGKNGVNVDGYKNMAGTFNQPDFVLCDTSMLRTLPEREFRAGLAEIIKSGLIADRELFELFERHTIDELRDDPALLRRIMGAVRVKARIVEADERETGERKKLNLGHTFAHAVEKTSREFLHGEAVAIGLAMIADLSVREGTLTEDDARRIKEALTRMGLPLASGVEYRKLVRALEMDKKKDASQVSLILMNGIGDCLIRPKSFEEIGAADMD